ncbi:hypothetical protein BC829DRAFT_404894 [Chytridium lagenaria]|nr:hypothetical protein BC829DRAFT_404894 [Chytridium lagenaria]
MKSRVTWLVCYNIIWIMVVLSPFSARFWGRPFGSRMVFAFFLSVFVWFFFSFRGF